MVRASASGVMVVLAIQALVSAGCESAPSSPSPRPDPMLDVTPLESSGPTRITFISSDPPPGSTIIGCGTLIEGCVGRMRMSFRLDSPSNGPVLYVRTYLHATNLIACLWGETASFSVQAGVAATLEIPLDRADGCGTPTTMATMAVVVEGPVEVASRQTWSLRYVFAP